MKKSQTILFGLPRNSIRNRLTVLSCLIILMGVLAFGSLSYIFARKTSLKIGEERLLSLSGQLRTMFSSNYRNYINSTRLAAQQPALKRFIQTGGTDSLEGSVRLLNSLRQDTFFVLAQLVRSDLQVLLQSADDSLAPGIHPGQVITEQVAVQNDSATIGRLHSFNEQVYFPVIAPVTDNDTLSGYLIRWRIIKSTAEALQQFSNLLGGGVGFAIGNKEGDVWTNLNRVVEGPPFREFTDSVVFRYQKNNTGAVMATMLEMPATGWLLSVELSENLILVASQRFLNWIILIGILLIITGMLLVWWMSGSFTKPVEDLTKASTEIAAGNLASRVDVRRRDELGKLAAAFNFMQEQLEISRRELATEAEKYRLLFVNNPMPMWIYEQDSFKILDVNEAAVRHYGYTRDEFLELNVKDLRPDEEKERFLEFAARHAGLSAFAGTWTHIKKNGELIQVDIISETIRYKNKQAKLILAHDVTEKMKMERDLNRQRHMQQKLITETRILVQEKEREEMGKELHDNINQLLATARIYLEMGIARNQDTERLEISRKYLLTAMEEIRKLSRSLVAPSLQTSSLLTCIREMAQSLGEATPLKIRLQAEDYQEKLLSNDMKLMFYRITQEQLSNILKHAGADHVTIRISATTDEATMEITDDGVGFNTEKTPRGIGLRNITTRVDYFDGQVEIISSPGHGCTLKVSVPLNHEVLA